MEKKEVWINTMFLSPNTSRRFTKGRRKNSQAVRNIEDTVPECTEMMLLNTKLMDFQVVRNVKLCRSGFSRYTEAEVRLKENASP